MNTFILNLFKTCISVSREGKSFLFYLQCVMMEDPQGFSSLHSAKVWNPNLISKGFYHF